MFKKYIVKNTKSQIYKINKTPYIIVYTHLCIKVLINKITISMSEAGKYLYWFYNDLFFF